MGAATDATRLAAMQMLDEKSNNDVEVSWEDQQMINRFSRLNSTFSDVEDELKAKRAEREELEDLGLELEHMEDEDVLYKIGDAYMSMPQSEAVEQLEQDTRRTSAELARLEDQMSECEKGMSELKVKLYARFGSNINLER